MYRKKRRISLALLSLTAALSCLLLSGCEVTDLPVDPSQTETSGTETTGETGAQTTASQTDSTTTTQSGASFDLIEERYTQGLSEITRWSSIRMGNSLTGHPRKAVCK